MGERVIVEAMTAEDRSFVQLAGELHGAFEPSGSSAAPACIAFCVGGDCSGGFTLRERDVVAAEPYELSIDGVDCGGLVIRLCGGGLISIERDWEG